MTLAKERAALITEFLDADEERAIKMVALRPNEAVRKINALGYDFSEDEFIQYAKSVRTMSESGELDLEALDDVAGGNTTNLSAALVPGSCVIVGEMLSTRVW